MFSQEGQPAPEATVFPHVALAEVLAEMFTQVCGCVGVIETGRLTGRGKKGA